MTPINKGGQKRFHIAHRSSMTAHYLFLSDFVLLELQHPSQRNLEVSFFLPGGRQQEMLVSGRPDLEGQPLHGAVLLLHRRHTGGTFLHIWAKFECLGQVK